MGTTKYKLDADDVYVGTSEVCDMLGGCHETTIYRWLSGTSKFRRPDFPKPIRSLIGNRLAWKKSRSMRNLLQSL